MKTAAVIAGLIALFALFALFGIVGAPDYILELERENASLRTELAKYESVQMPCVPVAMGDE